MYCMVADTDSFGLGQLRRGVAEYCVLALLRQGSGYGFDLAQTLAAAGLIAGEGTMYPLLARLRKVGRVESFWQESAEGPPRRYYRLTAAGHEALDCFTSQWLRFRSTVDQLLAEGGEFPNVEPECRR